MNKVAVHTELLDINWKLIGLISEIDRFDASWKAIERREGQSLKELKSIATVRSVGAPGAVVLAYSFKGGRIQVRHCLGTFSPIVRPSFALETKHCRRIVTG